MNQFNIELDSISFTPLTVNPVLSPPGGEAYFFQALLRGGGLIERGGLKEKGGGTYLI